MSEGRREGTGWYSRYLAASYVCLYARVQNGEHLYLFRGWMDAFSPCEVLHAEGRFLGVLLAGCPHSFGP